MRISHLAISISTPSAGLSLGTLGRNIFLAALLGGLTACAPTVEPAVRPPPSPPPRIAAISVPEEPPPLPKRKPASPTPQASSQADAQPSSYRGPNPATAGPGPPASNDPHLAIPDLVPSNPDTQDDLIGLESDAIEYRLGQPESRRDMPPAVVWHYANDACSLDIWLYRDLQSSALRALFTEVKGDDRTEQRRQSCIRHLALQSTGGTRPVGADAASPR